MNSADSYGLGFGLFDAPITAVCLFVMSSMPLHSALWSSNCSKSRMRLFGPCTHVLPLELDELLLDYDDELNVEVVESSVIRSSMSM